MRVARIRRFSVVNGSISSLARKELFKLGYLDHNLVLNPDGTMRSLSMWNFMKGTICDDSGILKERSASKERFCRQKGLLPKGTFGFG